MGTTDMDDLRQQLIAKAEWHREEAARVQKMADQIYQIIDEANAILHPSRNKIVRERLSPEDLFPAGLSKRTGRPLKSDSVDAEIIGIIANHAEVGQEFSNIELRNWAKGEGLAGYDPDSEAFSAAFKASVRRMIHDQVIRVDQQPTGRRPGVYVRQR